MQSRSSQRQPPSRHQMSRDQQYAQEVEDEELQNLMRQVVQNRKTEKDYKNIEDQIRCLKLRMIQVNQQRPAEPVAALATQTEDLMLQHEAMERHRVQQEDRYTHMKHEYIQLNNLEGELHAQISNLRGNTSDQMVQNKQLEQRLTQEQQVAQRLRGQLQDVDGQIRAESQAIDVMDHKRRATELETQDTLAKVEACERDIYAHRQQINQLNMDNKARRDVLDQTSESMTELGNMLQDMRHSTDKLRQIFWEQEKKIEYLRRDLDQCDETRRQKEKRRQDLQTESAELEKTLQIRKMELAVEKENEVAILKHKEDLTDRLQQLNAEIVQLEQKQKILNEKLIEFVEVNERIRQELFQRDRAAEIKTCMNQAIVANSDAERREAQSKSRSRSPTRRSHGQDLAGASSMRKSSPLRRPSKSPSTRYAGTTSNNGMESGVHPQQLFQSTYVPSGSQARERYYE